MKLKSWHSSGNQQFLDVGTGRVGHRSSSMVQWSGFSVELVILRHLLLPLPPCPFQYDRFLDDHIAVGAHHWLLSCRDCQPWEHFTVKRFSVISFLIVGLPSLLFYATKAIIQFLQLFVILLCCGSQCTHILVQVSNSLSQD